MWPAGWGGAAGCTAAAMEGGRRGGSGRLRALVNRAAPPLHSFPLDSTPSTQRPAQL